MTCSFCSGAVVTTIGKARYCRHCLSSREHNSACSGCSRSDCYSYQHKQRKAFLKKKRVSKSKREREAEREGWAANPKKRRKKNPCAGCARLAKYGKLCKRHAPSDFLPLVPRNSVSIAERLTRHDGRATYGPQDAYRSIGQYTKKKNPPKKRRKRKSNPSPKTMNAVLKLGMLIGVLFAIKKFVGK